MVDLFLGILEGDEGKVGAAHDYQCDCVHELMRREQPTASWLEACLHCCTALRTALLWEVLACLICCSAHDCRSSFPPACEVPGGRSSSKSVLSPGGQRRNCGSGRTADSGARNPGRHA